VVGDLVLKWKTDQDGMHKLSSPWEGPFEVTEVTRPTSYRLAYLDGTVLPNSWHIDKLRRFYPWSAEKERYVPLLYFDYFNKASMFHSICLFDTIFLSIFYNRPVDKPLFFLEFSELAPSLTSPHACTGSALYVPGGRRALLGLTCALLRVNRLCASLSNHRSG
jgi:hypothetical protein